MSWIAVLSSISLIVCVHPLICATFGFIFVDRLWLSWVVAGAIAGGAVLGTKSQHHESRLRSPGVPSHLIQFRVLKASQPGFFCRVWLQDKEDSEAFVVKISMDDCPLWQGQVVAIRSNELHRQLSPDVNHREGILAFSPQVPVIRSIWRTEEKGSKYWRVIAHLRMWAWTTSRGDRGLSLAFAGALGMPQCLAPQDRQALRRSGLGHLVAVSGLHISLVGLLLQRILFRLFIGLGQRVGWATALAWVPAIAYVMLTGASASAVRACGMMIVVGIGGILGRPTHGLSVLALVVSLMLLWRPAWIVEPGFQLSVCAMMALIHAGHCGVIRQSWHISWALAPLCWWHFGEASLWGVLVNCLAIPIFSGWVLPWTICGALLSLAGIEYAWACARFGGEFLLDLAGLCARLPIISLDVWVFFFAIPWVFIVGLRHLQRSGGRIYGLHRFAFDKWLANWSPPKFVWVVLAVVFIWRSEANTTSSRGWFVWGTARNHVVGVQAQSDSEPNLEPNSAVPGELCLRGNLGHAAQLQKIVEELGYHRIVSIDLQQHGANQSALRWLDDRGWLSLRPNLRPMGCVFPESEVIRGALKRCRRRTAGTKMLIRAGLPGQPPECWNGRQWQSLS